MPKTRWRGALAAFPVVVILLTACSGATGSEGNTPAAGPTLAAAAPTEDAGALATRGANSPAAKLGPTVLNTADFPPDLSVQRQAAQIIAAGDVPGLTSEASGFFADLATASGDEFVDVIAVAVGSDAGASTTLDALTPNNYLSGLTAGAPDAATSPLDVSSAPPGSKGFNYSGTAPAAAPGEPTGGSIAGQALGFVRGSTYVLVVHGMFAPSTRGIEVAKIAAAINTRLGATGP
jgi:hypothetical protein